MATLVSDFEEIESDDKIIYGTFQLNPKSEAFINENDIDDTFESIYSTVMSNIQIDHNINISKYNLLARSSISNYQKTWIMQKKGSLIFKILITMNALNCV